MADSRACGGNKSPPRGRLLPATMPHLTPWAARLTRLPALLSANQRNLRRGQDHGDSEAISPIATFCPPGEAEPYECEPSIWPAQIANFIPYPCCTPTVVVAPVVALRRFPGFSYLVARQSAKFWVNIFPCMAPSATPMPIRR